MGFHDLYRWLWGWWSSSGSTPPAVTATRFALWSDPVRTATWSDPTRTAVWSDPTRTATWSD